MAVYGKLVKAVSMDSHRLILFRLETGQKTTVRCGKQEKTRKTMNNDKKKYCQDCKYSSTRQGSGAHPEHVCQNPLSINSTGNAIVYRKFCCVVFDRKEET